MESELKKKAQILYTCKFCDGTVKWNDAQYFECEKCGKTMVYAKRELVLPVTEIKKWLEEKIEKEQQYEEDSFRHGEFKTDNHSDLFKDLIQELCLLEKEGEEK